MYTTCTLHVHVICTCIYKMCTCTYLMCASTIRYISCTYKICTYPICTCTYKIHIMYIMCMHHVQVHIKYIHVHIRYVHVRILCVYNYICMCVCVCVCVLHIHVPPKAYNNSSPCNKDSAGGGYKDFNNFKLQYFILIIIISINLSRETERVRQIE